MKSLFVLITFFLFSGPEIAWAQKVVDDFFGELVYSFSGKKCNDANLSEYETAICELGVGHPGAETYRRIAGQQNAEAFFERMTEEVVYHAAAMKLHDQNKCQKDFFDLYDQNSSEKTKLNTLALDQFNAVKSSIANSDRVVRDSNARLTDELFYHQMMAGNSMDAANLSFDSMTQHDERISVDLNMLDALTSSIPMGNRPEMKTFLRRAARESYSDQKFIDGYKAVMKELQTQATNSYNVIKSFSYPHPNGDGLAFRIRETDEDGEAFRQSLVQSHMVESVLLQEGMDSKLKDGFMCRLKRRQTGEKVKLGVELAASFLVPYAAIGLSLRAGLVAARAGSSILRGGALATRGLANAALFGVGVIEGLQLKRDFDHSGCNAPEYLAMKESESCDARSQMFQTKAEASVVACMMNTAFPFVRVASSLNAVRLALKSKRATQIREEMAAIRAADEARAPVAAAPAVRAAPARAQAEAPVAEAPAVIVVNGHRSPAKTEAEVIERYGDDVITDAEQNAEFMKLATSTRQQPGIVFVDAQNSMLKWLNDNVKNKTLIDALNNRHSRLLQNAIDDLEFKYPGLKVETYSDYKGIRFAVKGPAGKEDKLADDLRKAIEDADKKFQSELAQGDYLKEGTRATDERWFSTGIGETADIANVQARFPPGTTRRDVEDTFFTVKSLRTDLEKKYGTTPLMRDVSEGDVAAKIPTAEVFELLRKNKDNDQVARILQGRHGISLDGDEVEKFRTYATEADRFSPGLLIGSRTEHNFDNATSGAITLDFGGVGSLNAESTAEALARGFSFKRSVMYTRSNEKAVSDYLDLTKNETEAAIRDVFSKRDIDVDITFSGDDMVIVPSVPVDETLKREILSAQRSAQEKVLEQTNQNTNVRVSFVREGIPVSENRAILAAEGEGIEKILRNRLEFTMSQEELRKVTFSTDMLGTSRGQGGVRLLIGGDLNPERREKLAEEFAAAVQDANKNYGSSFTPEP